MMISLILAATLLATERNGISLEMTSETDTICPAQNVFYVTLTVTAPSNITVKLPDLHKRVRGFKDPRPEDFYEDEKKRETLEGGLVRRVFKLGLDPEPCAEEYKILPFAVTVAPNAADGFLARPEKFKVPPHAAVTGGMKFDLGRDWWADLNMASIVLAILAALAILAGIFFLIKYLASRVREHFMSPIERAWVELDRLLEKGLPGRGRYKDFYIELTMVVRRYVQRQHGVKAPHLTTEEFFEATRNSPTFPQSTLDLLIDFLRKADMVKFAGVEATPDTAESAAESARSYISKDDEIVRKKTEYARKHGGAK